MAKLKICGIVDVETAEYCVSVGVDYIGFVFYPKSSRYINFLDFKHIAKQLRLTNKLKTTKLVGLFVDRSLSEIKEYTDTQLLDIVQLHGTEDIKYIKELKTTTGVGIIKTVSFADYATNFVSYQSCSAIDYLLFDSKTVDTGLKLGQSKTLDLERLKELTTTTNLQKDYFLAGGLTAKNIVEASNISFSKNFDVSSGAEDADGNKSKEKIFELREITNYL